LVEIEKDSGNKFSKNSLRGRELRGRYGGIRVRRSQQSNHQTIKPFKIKIDPCMWTFSFRGE